MTRLLVVSALLAALGGWTPLVAAPAYARLRPQSARIAAWIERGLAASDTFRDLVEQIERRDVIVFLDIDPRLNRGLSAGLTWMATTPSARLVRASFRPDLPAREAVAMLAHELQHVLEVAEHPEVQSAETLAGLYARIGNRSSPAGRSWDTLAALRAGDQVRRELLG
ncbi:MAG: hypothetical protein AB7U83_11280 [Vicinamibacterales bacterium]